MKNQLPINLFIYALLLITCILILFQSALVPFFNVVPVGDSSNFIYSASQILKGQLMYQEIFDHKGPFLYVIDIIGLLIHRYSGIWVLELISLFTASLVIYHTIRQFYNRFVSALSVILSLLFLVNKFGEGGNYTQEWALPYISIAIYIFSQHFLKGKKFTLWQLGLLSVSFVLTFLLQPNLIAVWIVFGVIIFF